MPHDLDESSRGASPAELDALSRLLRAAGDLVNHKLGGELAGSEFAGALRSGAASLQLVIELPSGRLVARAKYPAMGPAPLELFEVVPPAKRASDA